MSSFRFVSLLPSSLSSFLPSSSYLLAASTFGCVGGGGGSVTNGTSTPAVATRFYVIPCMYIDGTSATPSRMPNQLCWSNEGWSGIEAERSNFYVSQQFNASLECNFSWNRERNEGSFHDQLVTNLCLSQSKNRTLPHTVEHSTAVWHNLFIFCIFQLHRWHPDPAY